jgi:hypothetical protein
MRLQTTPPLMTLWRLTYKILHRRLIRLPTLKMQSRRTMMMPARLCSPSSFSRHRFRHSTRFALIHCLLIRYRIQQLLQLLLAASKLLLLQHLRLCSIALILTRYRMCARSRKEPSRITTRAVLKSATIGKPLASPRPAVTAKSRAVNKLLLVGRKLKRFFPTLGNFVAKVSMYNPDTDSYCLFYPSDDHEEWLPLSEVDKLLGCPKAGLEMRNKQTLWRSATL